ncbi:hypothetical protein L598_002600000070 [Mesorhizobium sp. J18]|uniref:hypothetical protein n=1 Tax=Mesorhizobium sp. J18 TaxID=935263 RepID=UPI00119BAFE4|nr:hypothetical protein [Mesorhizobium sp. J18]TWG96377.1 hypothetical protein L598_002600000070 [Mesorhizobium sp. J18]
MSSSDPEHHIPPEVRAAISAFLAEGGRDHHPFTMSDAMDAVRRVFPDLELSDQELVDAITSEAAAAGQDLRYDEPNIPRNNSLDRWEDEGGAVGAKPRTK